MNYYLCRCKVIFATVAFIPFYPELYVRNTDLKIRVACLSTISKLLARIHSGGRLAEIMPKQLTPKLESQIKAELCKTTIKTI